jgi:hypothetical protein
MKISIQKNVVEIFERNAGEPQHIIDESLALTDAMQTDKAKQNIIVQLCLMWKMLKTKISELQEELKPKQDRLKKQKEIQKICEESVLKIMQKNSYESVVDTLAEAKISASRPSVEILNEDAIPDEYKTITVTVNKTAIHNAIKEGKHVPGAKLSAGEHIRIK